MRSGGPFRGRGKASGDGEGAMVADSPGPRSCHDRESRRRRPAKAECRLFAAPAPPVPNPIQARLLPHPSTPCADVDSIAVSIVRAADVLAIEYRLSGRIERLAVLPAAPPVRADDLWRTTCCELFVGVPGSPAYREYNFSPSGRWATYDFSSLRRRAADPEVSPPAVRSAVSGQSLQLAVTLPWPPTSLAGPLELALSAVIESRDGALSYWALHHPAPQPDFHHRASFALRLDPTP